MQTRACLLVGLLLAGCDSEAPLSYPIANTVASEQRERKLSQFFGSRQTNTGRDLFFSTGPSKRKKPTAESSLPLLVGIVLQGDEPAAFFVHDGQSQVFKEGDSIAHRYRIVKIDASFVVVEDASAGRTYRIVLTES